MIKQIKNLIKLILPPFISMPVKDILASPSTFEAIKRDLNCLMNARKLAKKGISQRELLRNAEFKIYSQNGEDGIINHIFSKIGTTNKKFVEFGIEDGRECNTANLSINNGWSGLLMDGNKKSISEARYYYGKKISVLPNRVRIIKCFITADNINKILTDNNISGEIDLLSIDIDGNDYWIWKEINAINPRVVVIEYNSSFGDENSITVRYDSGFDRFRKHKSGRYYGASLAALSKLGKKKGYILVGCDSSGCNAFFIKMDVASKKFHETSVKEAFYSQLRRINESLESQFDKIKHLNFKKV